MIRDNPNSSKMQEKPHNLLQNRIPVADYMGSKYTVYLKPHFNCDSAFT